MTLELRDYQEASLAKAEQYLIKKGGTSGIFHLATGLGKTVLTVEFVHRYMNPRNGKRTIVIGGVNNTLTFQMYDAFVNAYPYLKGALPFGGRMVKALGIVMNTYNDVDARIVIASIQTLMSKNDELSAAKKPIEMEPITINDIIVNKKTGTVHLNPKSKRRWLVSERMDAMLAAGGLFDTMVLDECHHSPADSSVIVVTRLHQIHQVLGKDLMKVIGNTATPARADGRGLHTLFETILASYDYQFGQRHGYLVPFAEPLRILVDTVESDGQGGHVPGVIANRTVSRFTDNWDEIIARGWQEKAEGRPTFSYVSSHNDGSHVADSKKLTLTMQSMGIRAAHVDGFGCIGPDGAELSKDHQRPLLKMMQRGELDVINNYNVLIEGVDVTRVSCILNARTISSENPVLLTQMLGRGLRPDKASNKTNLLVIDATGDALVLNGIAELSGFKVDPGSGQYIEDFDIEIIFNELVRLCSEQPDRVGKWKVEQRRFAIATIEESFDLAFKFDTDNVSTTHLRCLQDCIEFCNDEDKLMDGLDLRDLGLKNNMIGINQGYDVIKITSKSKAAWYVDEESTLMSLSVAAGLSFVLHPPNYSKERIAKEALEGIQKGILPELTDGKNPEQLEKMQQFLKKSIELFGNYTLWSVDTAEPWNAKISERFGKFWLQAQTGLSEIEDYAFSFARDNIEEYTPGFAEKKGRKSWTYEDPSEKQVMMYHRLVGGELPEQLKKNYADGGWSRGEVSKRINHVAAVKPVEKTVANFENQIQRIKEIL